MGPRRVLGYFTELMITTVCEVVEVCILVPETVGMSIQNEAIDGTRSASQGTYYHMGVIHLLPLLILLLRVTPTFFKPLHPIPRM